MQTTGQYRLNFYILVRDFVLNELRLIISYCMVILFYIATQHPQRRDLILMRRRRLP